eukprot:jgi/Tetstr1/441644/TSEL_029869.t1
MRGSALLRPGGSYAWQRPAPKHAACRAGRRRQLVVSARRGRAEAEEDDWQPLVKGRASLWGKDTVESGASPVDPIKDGFVYTQPRQAGAVPPVTPPAVASPLPWVATGSDPGRTESSPKSAMGGFVAGMTTDLVGVEKQDLTAALADVQGKEDRLLKAQALVKEMRAKANAMQRRLKAQLEEREGELKMAMQAARALELEVEAVGRVVKAQEAEIEAVQAAASEHSMAAQSALDESQRRVGLLEAMVATLRSQLEVEEGRSSGLAERVAEGQEALKTANTRIAELEARIEGLEVELGDAQQRYRRAEEEAEQLQARQEELEAEGDKLRAALAQMEEAAAAQAAEAAEAAERAEQRVAALTGRAEMAEMHVSEVEAALQAAGAELAEAEEQAAAAMAAKVAEMAKMEASYQAEAEAAAADLKVRKTEADATRLELNEALRRLAGKEGEVEEARAAAAAAAEETENVRAALVGGGAEVEELQARLSDAQAEVDMVRAAGDRTTGNLKSEVARKAAQLQAAQQAAKAAEEGAAEREAALVEKEAALAKAQHMVAQRETELEAVRSLVKVRDQRRQESAAKAAAAEGLVATLREAVADRDLAMERLQSLVRQRERAVAAAEAEVAAAQVQAEEEMRRRQREVEAVRGQLQPALLAARAQLDKQRGELAKMRDGYEARLAAIAEETAAVAEAAAQEEKKAAATAAEVAAAEAALRKARKEAEMIQGLLTSVAAECRGYLGPAEKQREAELSQEAEVLAAALAGAGPGKRDELAAKLEAKQAAAEMLLQAVMPGDLLQKESRLKKQMAEAAEAAGFLQEAMAEVQAREAALAAREAALEKAEAEAAEAAAAQGSSTEQAAAMQDAVTSQLGELRAFQQEMKQQQASMQKMREKYDAEVSSAQSRAQEATAAAEELRREMAQRNAELAALRSVQPSAASLMVAALEAEAMLAAAVQQQQQGQALRARGAEGGAEPPSNGAPPPPGGAGGPPEGQPQAAGAAPGAASSDYSNLQELSDALWGSNSPGRSSGVSASVKHREAAATAAPPPKPATPASAPASSAQQGRLLGLQCAGFSVPHPSKVEKGGEDAFFASPVEADSAPLFLGAIGVADGVGGWSEDGVDPAAYARTLMQNCELAASPPAALTPQEVMDDAHLLTELPGSATAVVAVLRESGSLSVANLGDCGFRVVRGSGALVKSKPQQHEFNMPFQLAWSKVLPDTDTAMDAQLYELEVQEDDVLVFGSDGLFDNMWDEELTTIVQDFTRNTPKPYSNEDAAALAKKLAEKAAQNSTTPEYRSPWSVAAANAGAVPLLSRLFPRGGKPDDTTVVVGFLEDMTPQ